MKWPGQLPAGTVCHEPMMTIDLLPTIASIIGASLPNHKIDGLNALPIVNGEANAKCPHAAYFFYYRVNDLEAMRSGRWKLHFPHEYRTLAGRGGGKNGQPVPYKQMKMGLELFDLEQDPRETTNVASKHPDVVERLQKLADNMREDLGDRLTGVTGEGSREPGQYAASKRDHNAANQSISTSAIEVHR
jgi:arylsulfatase A-like enzyme